MKKVLILTEAGEMGFGHLSRTQAIKEEFDDAKLLCAKFGEFDIDEEIFNWHEGNVEVEDFDTVLVDSYLMSSEKETELRAKFKHFVVLDDYNRKKYRADLVVNPNIYGDNLDYSNQSGKAVGGKEYVTIRTSIMKNKKPKPITFLKNLLITLGGNPDFELLSTIVNEFKDDFVKTTVLLSNSDLKKRVQSKFPDIKVVNNLDGKKLAKLFSSTDLAITAGGVTMNELAFCGVSFIGVETQENQKSNIEAFTKEEILNTHLISTDTDLMEKLRLEVDRLKDEELRKKLSFKSQILVNGKGAREIVREIEDLGN